MNIRNNSIFNTIIIIIILSLGLTFNHLNTSKENIPFKQKNDYKDNKTPPITEPEEIIKIKKVNSGVTVEGIQLGNLKYNKVKEIISKISEQKKEETQNAFIFNKKITSEKIGKKINIPASIRKIMHAEPNQTINLVYNSIFPTITKKNLLSKERLNLKFTDKKGKERKIKGHIIGHYSTYLQNNNDNRRTNIINALKELNYSYIKPKDEFSFNNLIGFPNKKKGYKEATIIDSGKLIPKVGGGICQVSSTLYNAVRKGNLKITEHHHHSQTIDYVPQGADATVVPGQKDFKFINNTRIPIIIISDIIDKYVIIYLIAEERDKILF